MKIFLLSQNVNTEYDTYDAIIVVAHDAEDAKTIDPKGDHFKDEGQWTSWVHSIEDINVTEIGEANEMQQRGVILASFNAG